MANNNDEGCISATGNNPEGLSIVSATDLDLEMTQNSSDGVTAGGMTMAAPIESMTTTTATLTLTETRTQQEGQVLRLTLRPPPRVTWCVHFGGLSFLLRIFVGSAVFKGYMMILDLTTVYARMHGW